MTFPPIPRRAFVQQCAQTTLAAAMPASMLRERQRAISDVIRNPSVAPSALSTLYDPKVYALAQQAIDAAVHTGARYADVRITNTINRSCPNPRVVQDVQLEMSVRSLVNGYWGWSSTPMILSAEATRVGTMSAQLATEAAAQGRPRTVDLGTIPVTHGTWETPVQTDPFDLQVTEIYDWLRGMVSYVESYGDSRSGGTGASVGTMMGNFQIGVALQRQERLFASSEGSQTVQTVKTIFPCFTFRYRGALTALPNYNRTVQGGWERMAQQSDAAVHDLVRMAMDETDRRLAHPSLPVKAAEIGRYDIVYSASAIAALLEATLIPATELDRALGYEANVSGTSYLGPDPMRLLGTTVAAPVINVTAERSTPDAIATVKWDDEGVEPESFSLIRNGVLVDYQTTREQASWLAPWYTKQGKPARSRGCAVTPSAGSVTIQHTPNIVMQPSAENIGIDDLINGMSHGLLVDGLSISQIDFQCSNGFAMLGGITEIRNGRRVARLSGFGSGAVGSWFRSADLWKNVQTVGGAATAEWFDGNSTSKGEPGQQTQYSVSAVPALIKNQAILDPFKKA